MSNYLLQSCWIRALFPQQSPTAIEPVTRRALLELVVLVLLLQGIIIGRWITHQTLLVRHLAWTQLTLASRRRQRAGSRHRSQRNVCTIIQKNSANIYYIKVYTKHTHIQRNKQIFHGACLEWKREGGNKELFAPFDTRLKINGETLFQFQHFMPTAKWEKNS